LALHGVSATETFGRGSHLGSTLKPGRAVLTGGVFRRSGSVACVHADASPSEVLASTIVDAETRCRQAYYAFSTPGTVHSQTGASTAVSAAPE
jgi:hypothetical protein